MNNTSLLERCLPLARCSLLSAHRLADWYGQEQQLETLIKDLEAAIAEQKDPISHYARGYTDAMHRAEQAKPQEPFAFHVECNDPDYSGFFFSKPDALSHESDHPGEITTLYSHPHAREPTSDNRQAILARLPLREAIPTLDDGGVVVIYGDQATPNQYEQAIDDELVNSFLGTKDDFKDAKSALLAIIEWNCKVALDPAVSAEAAALIAQATTGLDG